MTVTSVTVKSAESASTGAEKKFSVSIPFLSGVGAGVVSTLLCNPLDVAKVRLQVQGAMHFEKSKLRYLGAFGTLRTIVREEGASGVFKGLGVALWTIPLFWGIYWQVYDTGKIYLSMHAPNIPTSIAHMISAVGAGAVGNFVVNPFWVIKTRIQTQIFNEHGDTQMGFFGVIRSIHEKEGLPAFYKGLNASLLGLSHVAIQFPLYEILKDVARKYRRGEENFIDLLLSSIGAKIVASTITYPHEVVRARLQYSSLVYRMHMVEVLLDILKNEGFRGLYGGYTMNLVRIGPSTVCTFLAYEYIARYLKSKESD